MTVYNKVGVTLAEQCIFLSCLEIEFKLLLVLIMFSHPFIHLKSTKDSFLCEYRSSSSRDNVFCILSSLPLLPPATTAMFGFYNLPVISPLLTNTVSPVRACLILWRDTGEISWEPKRRRLVALLVFSLIWFPLRSVTFQKSFPFYSLIKTLSLLHVYVTPLQQITVIIKYLELYCYMKPIVMQFKLGSSLRRHLSSWRSLYKLKSPETIKHSVSRRFWLSVLCFVLS